MTLEGFPRINVRPDVWGLTGARNETPVGERIFWMTYQLRTWFAPTDFPDLERITVTNAFPFGDYEPGNSKSTSATSSIPTRCRRRCRPIHHEEMT